MPLERYEAGRVFLGSDTCVYFSMVVAGGQKLVPCRVSAEALEGLPASAATVLETASPISGAMRRALGG